MFDISLDNVWNLWPQVSQRLKRVCFVRYTFVDILRAILLSLESMIEDPELQVNGFILIIDWSNFTFKQASKLTPSMLRLAIEGLQVRRVRARKEDCFYLWVFHQFILFYLEQECICSQSGSSADWLWQQYDFADQQAAGHSPSGSSLDGHCWRVAGVAALAPVCLESALWG